MRPRGLSWSPAQRRPFFFTPNDGRPVVFPVQGASPPGLNAPFLGLCFFFALPSPIGLPGLPPSQGLAPSQDDVE